MRSEKTKIGCTRYYDAEAEEYDYKRFSCDCDKIHDRILKKIIYGYLKNCRCVLDAGAGTGRFAIYLAKKKIKIIVLDSSPRMLRIAKHKAMIEGVEDRIGFVLGDIENIPFKNSSFDGVYSIYVLIHFVYKDKIISEFSRLLKSNGVVVFDMPNKVLSKAYRIFLSLLGNPTFPDYPYSSKEIEKLLSVNSIKLDDKKSFGKIPRLVIHFFLCKANLGFLKDGIERFERFNFGSVSIVRGTKIK